jgi:sulfide:quinone oxidoreductase
MRKTISQRLSVGEQPRKADLEELKKDGVTTVVNLRVVGEETPLTPAEERALAEQLGLQYHHLPISLDKLNAAQVKELREILENSKGQVFVHCGLGQRACSFSLAASGVDTDSIFEQARELGFPVQDEKLRVFLNSLKG